MTQLKVFIIGLTILTSELALGRALDVALTPALSWICIACAMLGIGLAGLVVTLRQKPYSDSHPMLFAIFGVSLCFMKLSVNRLNLDLDQPLALAAIYYACLQLMLVVPFFLGGVVLISCFTEQRTRFGSLYFFDLAGGALGCAASVILLNWLNPSQILYLMGAIAICFSIALYAQSKIKWAWLKIVFLSLLIFISGKTSQDDFRYQVTKRNSSIMEKPKLEFSHWDLVSKIDVVALPNQTKMILYDGGYMNSRIVNFDGDFTALRKRVNQGTWHPLGSPEVAAAHYLKRDRGSKVLLIGAAGGKEIVASILFGAKQVDVAEMVKTVLDLGRDQYKTVNGGIFLHPAVHLYASEGRAFLRRNQAASYDIIQLFSTTTNSTAGSGNGVFQISSLFTVEAFQEYLNHLNAGGILQMNHTSFPRMITTLSKAWKKMGMDHLEQHVVVIDQMKDGLPVDNLPTILFKMTPWELNDILDLKQIFNSSYDYVFLEDPTQNIHFLNADFYSGTMTPFLKNLPYDASPAVDDHPYIKFLRKNFHVPNQSELAQIRKVPSMTGITMEYFENTLNFNLLKIMGWVILFYVLLIAILSAIIARRSKDETHFVPLISYFSSIGFGFIFLELFLINKLTQGVGYPYMAAAVAITALMIGAGVGSKASETWLKVLKIKRFMPFYFIITVSLILGISLPAFNHFISDKDTFVRLALAFFYIFPLGLFMGIPFPLGIRNLSELIPSQIGWAWLANGVASILGAYIAIHFSVWIGFNSLLYSALIFYAIAALTLKFNQHFQKST